MRLFVALYPAQSAVDDLDAMLAPLRAGSTIRWTSWDQWHITLAFLGEVRDEVVGDVAESIGTAVEVTDPFRLSLRGAGSFGGRAGAVVWAGVAGDLDRLAALTRDVGEAARSAGATYPDHRPQPHVTLGRETRGERGRGGAAQSVVHALSRYDGPSWEVRDVRLVRSVLGPSLQHTPIATCPLGVSGT